jgi:peptidyl-prolyl cis-trans isomerase C
LVVIERKRSAVCLPEQQVLSVEERAELRRNYLRQLIDRELAMAEADRLAIEVTREEVDSVLAEYRLDYPEQQFQEMLKSQGISEQAWQQELEERLRMEKVILQEVYAGITVEKSEINTYFRQNREEFERPEQVRARQIVVSSEEEGQRALGVLRQGEPFEQVAKEYSLSPDREQGGDLGYFSRGQMPDAFDEVVFKLPVGRLSDLVKTDYGYHIFLVEERRRAQRLTLSEVRDEIEMQLRREKEEAAYQAWLQELGAQAVIEVDWTLLNEPHQP